MELLQTVLDEVPAGIALLRGRDFVFELVNPAYQAIDPARAFLGRGVAEVWPELAHTVLPLLQGVVDSGRPFHADDMRLDILRGQPPLPEEAYFSFTYQPIAADAQGRPGVLVTVIETSAQVRGRRRAEAGEARADAERERLAVTLRSIGDAVIATDTSARIQIFNRVAEALTGWPAQEAIGRPLGEVFRIVDARTRQPSKDPVTRVLDSGKVVGLANHTLLLARDGTERAIADSGAPIRDSESRTVGVVLVFRDVTDEERREAALARTERLESLAVMAGGIAHDFNNILTGVLANLALALEEARGASLVEVLEEARSAAQRASGLTQQLLTFAKGGAPVRQVADVSTMVQETARFCTHGWPGVCRFALPADLWHAHVDPGQMAQVVQNVVINAVEAMPGGGTITIGVENLPLGADNVQLVPEGPYLRIRIEDDGPGIPAEVREQIFEPFFSTKQRGSGLGLAVCHSIMARHDGRIEVAERHGRGTTFDLYFPARPGAPVGQPVTPKTPSTGGGRVLVMDDEESIRRAAVRVLGTIGCEAVAVEGGQEAVARFEEARSAGRPFDLVVLDLTVPGGMGGLSTLAALRAIDPDVVAIVSSGFSIDPVMSNHEAHGFAAVLLKPYEPAQLRAVVSRLVDGRRGRDGGHSVGRSTPSA